VEREKNVAEYPLGEDDEAQKLGVEAMEHEKEEDKALTGEKGFGRRDEDQGWRRMRERFDPYMNSSSSGTEYEKAVQCYLDSKTKLEIPQLMAYQGVPEGFPDPVIGSYDLLGLGNDVFRAAWTLGSLRIWIQ
jgi:hypothetical protein